MYLSKNKKSGTYYIYYRKDDGKKTRRSTGTDNKREALQFLIQFEKKAKVPKASITVGEFAWEYLKLISDTHTQNSYSITKRVIK